MKEETVEWTWGEEGAASKEPGTLGGVRWEARAGKGWGGGIRRRGEASVRGTGMSSEERSAWGNGKGSRSGRERGELNRSWSEQDEGRLRTSGGDRNGELGTEWRCTWQEEAVS